MKTIKKIFFTDVKNLAKNLFALIIAIGVCFLPALYAWFNIYSNWDPYGNTGNLQLAAVNLDQGYTDENGEFKNTGEDIMDELAGNDKVDWQFVDSADEAIEGVESGKYYAALVVQNNFTYNMYNMFVNTTEEPTLIFYQNQKKNPVANKISDTIVTTVQSNINEEFVKVMTKTIFEDVNDMYDDIEEEGGVDAFIDKLDNLNNNLIDYQKTIDNVIKGNAVLSSNIANATNDVEDFEGRTKNSAGSLSEAGSSLQQSQNTLNAYKDQMNLTIDTMLTMLNTMENQLKQAQLSGDIDQMANVCEQTLKDTNQLNKDITAISQSIADQNNNQNVVDTLQQLSDSVEALQKILEKANIDGKYDNVSQQIKDAEAAMISDIDKAIANITSTRNTINNQLVPQLNTCVDNLEDVIGNASTIMNNMSGVLNSMGNVFGSLQTTLSTSDKSLEKTKEALSKISDKLTKAIDKARSVQEDERVEALVNTLTGDPDMYGEFFSEPVEIESVAVYPIENYGSAVAPFYTVLSVWVGVIIMAAIIKVKVTKSKYPDATPTQLFFGRSLFFIAMGQVQTLITVLGDLFILKIQCVHPFLFWVVGALTSLTFTLLIYALVYSFGDVGKAIAVVVLVLQIAGSSGTYPIELLPEFFQKVYIFFPFPYAINAMRECICGLYEADIVIYLLKLLTFLVVGLVVGLWIRIPFEGLNHYMEERMEDTEMM
ncbi:MAG: YhgE/Pip domain-containing protein [Lachnospiraceae bacterium]|nr:YhgE/Pip domain-containing protein [Lachnospiraceae bacterium]